LITAVFGQRLADLRSGTSRVYRWRKGRLEIGMKPTASGEGIP
jgi:hypothetical protein